MTHARLGLAGLLGAAGLYVFGCNSDSGPDTSPRPINSTEATASINQRVDELIVGLANSTAQLDIVGGTAVATDSVNGTTTSSCGSAGGSDVSKSTTDGLDKFLRQIAQEAREHVFREEFVESKETNQVIYKINPVSVCDTDSTCIDKLTVNPIRFVVTAKNDDTLNVSMLVGEARYNPGTAVLGPKALSVRLDLARGLDALRLFVDIADQKDLPERFAGIVEAALEKRGDGDFALSGALIEKFDLVIGQAKGKRVAVTVQPSQPTAQVTLNSVTNTVGYSANLGAVDVQIAGTAVCDDSCGTKENAGTFSGHLGGLNARSSLTKCATDLTFSDVGLGKDTSRVALNNDSLGTLDVNPNNGRKFNVNFKKTDEGTLVTFDPALDIKLALTLNKLSDSLRVDMPSWLEDEIFDVMLGGAAKPSVLVPASNAVSSDNGGQKDIVKVQSGKLTVSSRSTKVEVTEGKCLAPVKGVDDNSNPVSRLTAEICQ
jgi:hypothetical protein